jgi:hypothetical protein
MDAVIFCIVIAVSLVSLGYFLGWMRGFDESYHIANYGIGFDDGYKACIENMGIEDSGQAP